MEAVLLIGIPGAGKTSFYLERFFDTHVRLSLDLLRTRHRERLLLEVCLAAKQRLVVDNTNLRRRERARYIRQAQAAGFRVVGYYFEPDLGGSLARNSARKDKMRLPPEAVVSMHRRREIPLIAEGFDTLYCVRIASGGGFAAEPWRVPPPMPAAGRRPFEGASQAVSGTNA